MEGFVEEGLIKSIGVSNFNEEQLSYLLEHVKIKPVINQFQSYPGKHQQSLIDFCKKNDVIPEAYQSFAKLSAKTIEVLKKISQTYNKTWSQVILNYQINEGLIVIPKSHNRKHQFENTDVFDFVLTEKDRKTIKDLNDN